MTVVAGHRAKEEQWGKAGGTRPCVVAVGRAFKGGRRTIGLRPYRKGAKKGKEDDAEGDDRCALVDERRSG